MIFSFVALPLIKINPVAYQQYEGLPITTSIRYQYAADSDTLGTGCVGHVAIVIIKIAIEPCARAPALGSVVSVVYADPVIGSIAPAMSIYYRSI
jgi:hypothetical protein